ncbi:MAG: PorT family protein [Candidatus Azobacteroides sp.]|nr:PorT family protein [Candidatus Azobacteroides sp.]
MKFGYNNKVKKSLLIIVFLGVISIQTYAETKEKVRFGVKGGINASTTSVSLPIPDFYTQYDTDYKFKIGFDAGVFVEFPLTKSLSFQPELALSLKGMRNESFILLNRPATSGYNNDLQATVKISLYYIKLPLYLKYDFDLDNSSKLIAGIGPYFAYGISGKMSSTLGYSTSSNYWIGKKNIFNEDNLNFNRSTILGGNSWTGENVMIWIREPYWHKSIKRFDGGISSFIGYELHNNWLITATYDFGLLNYLYPVEKWGEKLEGKMYNRTISITLGYKF